MSFEIQKTGLGQYPVHRWIPPRRRTLSRHLHYATSIVWGRQYYGVGRHNGTWQDTISCCRRTSDRNTLQGLNCSAICYSVYSSSMQQRHIPAGQRWTTYYACFTSLPDTAECWCVTVARCFTRSFTYWARLGWNGMTTTLSAKSASCVWNNIHKHVLAHWLDQCVAVPKLASMQMVDAHAIDFVNVQKISVLFKTSTQ